MEQEIQQWIKEEAGNNKQNACKPQPPPKPPGLQIIWVQKGGGPWVPWVVTPTSAPPNSPEHYVNMAKSIAEKTPNSFRINQYDNPKNPEAHYLTTGPEIWRQTEGKITHLVASGSTGGTVSGIGKYLKEQNSKIQVIMPDPIGSMYYEYFKTGKIVNDAGCTYQVEGVGEDHLAKAMDFSVVDEMSILYIQPFP